MIGILFAGLVATGAQALADDATMTTAQKRQMMKHCMQEKKMKDSTMSAADMKTACKNEMAMKKNGNDLTSADPHG
jgi:hypothetical protein